jgi:hypothetical protein
MLARVLPRVRNILLWRAQEPREWGIGPQLHVRLGRRGLFG